MLAFIFSAVTALLLMVGSAQADPPKRVALVVGNDGYRSLSPLHNPGLDARTLATILDANGFDVIKCDGQRPGCFDLTREGLFDALDKLRERAEGAELALVFYSGQRSTAALQSDYPPGRRRIQAGPAAKCAAILWNCARNGRIESR